METDSPPLKLILLDHSGVDKNPHPTSALLSDLLRTTWQLFQHEEPSANYSVHLVNTFTNLLNCVLEPQLLANWDTEIVQSFGAASLYNSQCSGGITAAACTDPLAYEAACSKLQRRQLLRANRMSLADVGAVLQANNDVKIVYMVRIGGIFGDAAMCKTIEEKLDTAASLLRHKDRYGILK